MSAEAVTAADTLTHTATLTTSTMDAEAVTTAEVLAEHQQAAFADVHNLTPHVIVLRASVHNIDVRVALPSDAELRASANEAKVISTIGAVSVYEDTQPTLSPADIAVLERFAGKRLIVSRVAGEAALRHYAAHPWPHAPTLLLGPNSAPGQAVRNDAGQIVAVKSLLLLGELKGSSSGGDGWRKRACRE